MKNFDKCDFKSLLYIVSPNKCTNQYANYCISDNPRVKIRTDKSIEFRQLNCGLFMTNTDHAIISNFNLTEI